LTSESLQDGFAQLKRELRRARRGASFGMFVPSTGWPRTPPISSSTSDGQSFEYFWRIAHELRRLLDREAVFRLAELASISNRYFNTFSF